MKQQSIRPYLIIPKLIKKPTWGGDYIVKKKKWDNTILSSIKIGQSYELYGASTLASSITDSSDKAFVPDMEGFHMPENISLEQLLSSDPESILGPTFVEKYSSIPILIKFTQALGNSFQIHKKPSSHSSTWKSKAESWYYFEKGYVTLGLKKDCDLSAYKQTCIDIDIFVQALSTKILTKQLTLDEAKKTAKEYIVKANPWNYVNVLDVPQNGCIDLSSGGIHHSWEEDQSLYPNGNILIEVQQDIDEESSTLRSFDQGKFLDDGTIRKIHIEDYFSYIDSDPIHNEVKSIPIRTSGSIFNTSYYAMDSLNIIQQTNMQTQSSFDYLFVKNGSIQVHTPSTTLKITEGHSCFIPWAVHSYTIKPDKAATILKVIIK